MNIEWSIFLATSIILFAFDKKGWATCASVLSIIVVLIHG